jgi:hypothetical protein
LAPPGLPKKGFVSLYPIDLCTLLPTVVLVRLDGNESLVYLKNRKTGAKMFDATPSDAFCVSQCVYTHIYVSRRRENWEKSLYPQHAGQKKKKTRKYKYIVEWDVYTVERVVSRSSVNFFFLFFLLIFLGRSSERKKKKKKSRSRRAVLAAMTTAAGNLTISRRPLCASE